MDLCNKDPSNSTEKKVCLGSDSLISIIVLLAKSECHQIMIGNEYSDNIETLIPSCQTYFVSPNQFEFINLTLLSCCLSSYEDYQGIILTSKRCVDALIMSLKLIPNFHPKNLSKLIFFTVGESTKAYLNEKLEIDSSGDHTGNSEELAQFILDLHRQSNLIKPLLYPCSEIRSDTLMKKLHGHVMIKEIVCYKTMPNIKINEDLQQFKLFLLEHMKKFYQSHILVTKQFKLVVVFFSPSGVENLLNPLKKFIIEDTDLIDSLQVKFVAFGRPTESKLKSSGLDVWFVATTPNAKSLAKDLKNLL